ncbi:MAG: HEAT repeat domain-containing protein [Gammaproteobacteria bacterium]
MPNFYFGVLTFVACSGMDNVKSSALAEKMEALLSDLDRVEPVSYDLGTPELPEPDAVRELANMGTEIVPLLLERMRGKVPKKRMAYIALVLSRIGDVRSLAPLRELRRRYQQREPKDEWDYAAIGQCTLAIEELRRRAR